MKVEKAPLESYAGLSILSRGKEEEEARIKEGFNLVCNKLMDCKIDVGGLDKQIQEIKEVFSPFFELKLFTIFIFY